MKKIIVIVFLLSCVNSGARNFEFIDQKIEGILSKSFIEHIIEEFKPDVFFETGTYSAETTRVAAPYFKQVYTVELHEKLYNDCKEKLKSLEHVHIFNDKSADAIARIAPTINGKIVFWLDAHYSGEGTALTHNNHEAPDAITAIREELLAIKNAHLGDCIILIDDIRGFGVTVGDREYLGCWAYPSVQEVQALLLDINPQFNVVLIGDILLAYDTTKYAPQFSETVIACTKTRLFDGCNIDDAQLVRYQEKIMGAPEREKEFIRSLYTKMTDYKDPMFWHDFWYGLVELGSQKYANAHKAFCKVALREQSFNKNRKLEPKIIPYEHWSIAEYKKRCLARKATR